jgi:hypothetical protein
MHAHKWKNDKHISQGGLMIINKGS